MVDFVDFTTLPVAVASNDGMTAEWWIGKDLEGSGRGVIEVLYRHLPGGTEENLNQDYLCHGRDSNRVAPEYKFRALPLHQSVRFYRSNKFCYMF
jgi:hypothetical protein